MRDESSIRLQKQAHVKKESHELEEEDGAYVSKPGTNACMASNHKSLHICFWNRYRRRPYCIPTKLEAKKESLS
jgi:hypothetical protein